MKRYLDEDYEFEVEVTGYLGGVKSLKAYAATVKSLAIIFLHLWVSSESGGIWNLLEDHDDAPSVDGSHWKWRRSEKCGRIWQV